MKRCIVWTAFGPKYINEAIFSAASFSQYEDRADTILITDKNSSEHVSKSSYSDVFSRILYHEFDDEFDLIFKKPGRLDSSKIWFLMRSLANVQDYETILYVDSDTYCFNELSPIWAELSDESDLAICKSPAIRWKNIEGQKPVILGIDELESTHFTINAGVILLRGSSMKMIINKWYTEFSALSQKFKDTGNYSINDQGVLKQLLISESFSYNLMSAVKFNATSFIFWPLFKKGLLSDIVIAHSHDIFKYDMSKSEDLVRIPGINTWPYSSSLIS